MSPCLPDTGSGVGIATGPAPGTGWSDVPASLSVALVGDREHHFMVIIRELIALFYARLTDR